MPRLMQRVLPMGLAVGWLALGTPASSEMLTLEPVRDNTLIESADGSRSNGAFERIFSGRTNQATDSIRRGLLAFDVAGAIPAGSTIDQVTLQLTHLSSNGPEDVSLHRALSDWGEGDSSAGGGSGAPAAVGDATWLHTFFATSFWVAAGGDFAPTASATTGVDLAATSVPTWSSPALTADVQGWLDTPASEFGWVVIGNESTGQTSQTFGSREQASAADRPQLLIDFTPPPNTVVLQAVADATLIETSPGIPLANGGAASLFVGQAPLDPGQAIRRVVLRFDVDATLPADAVIQSATLELLPDTTFVPHTVSVHRLSADWGEGDEASPPAPAALGEAADPGSATWFHSIFDTDPWTTAGGDFAAMASAQAFVDATDPESASFSSAQLAADVQGWVDDSASDFGWILIGDESSAEATLIRFPSREALTAADRPRLTIEYIPEPRALLLQLAATGPLLVGSAIRSRVRRKRT